MADNNSTNTLVDQKLALSLFLDSLLREPTTPEVEVPVQVPTPSPIQVKQTELAEPKRRQAEVEYATTSTAIHPVIPAEKTPTVTDAVPEWAHSFQAMLFRVAGLTLAVPLEELCGVVEYQDDLTEMPGHADFYLGVLQHLGKSIPVVDTARLVFPPEKLQELVGDEPKQRIKRIVLINESRWGLACDEVDEVITLTRDKVRWRSSRTKRKWLLGTVIEHMCALLDTRAFAEKLESG